VVIAAEAVADLQHALTQSGTRLTTVHRAQQSTRPEPVTRAAVNGEAPDLLKPLPHPYEPTVSTLSKSNVNGSQTTVTTLGERPVNLPAPMLHGYPAGRSRGCVDAANAAA
jgi:hypothetical protein